MALYLCQLCQLMLCWNWLNKSQMHKMYAIGVFVNSKKAFDTFDLDILATNCICVLCAVLHINR